MDKERIDKLRVGDQKPEDWIGKDPSISPWILDFHPGKAPSASQSKKPLPEQQGTGP